MAGGVGGLPDLVTGRGQFLDDLGAVQLRPVGRVYRLRAFLALYIGGDDVTDQFDPYVISVTITDKEFEQDECTIELDDRYGRAHMPDDQELIQVYLGWQEEGMASVFFGFMSDIESSSQRQSGRRLRIVALSTNLFSPVKQPISKNLGDGVGEDHNLQAAAEAFKPPNVEIKVAPDLANVVRKYWAATNESFMQWGMRVAREVNGVFKIRPAGGGMIATFTNAESFLNADGATLPLVACNVGRNVLAWKIKPKAARAQWGRAAAKWYDPDAAMIRTQEEAVSFAGGFFDMQTKFTGQQLGADQNVSTQNAQSDRGNSIKNRGTGWIIIDGEPSAMSQGRATVTGSRPGVDGTYKILEAEHTYHRGGGFTTRLDLGQPEPGAEFGQPQSPDLGIPVPGAG